MKRASRVSLRLIVLVSLFLLCFTWQSNTQVKLSYYLPSDVQYDPRIPTPESFFGFQVGEWHLSPDQIHAYMKVLDVASDRITMASMGRTYEQRQMWLLTITSPENHKRIEAIKQQHSALTDPARSSSLNIDVMPVFVWMGYSVHGNEPSGANSSVLVAYHLAAAQGPEIERQLKEAVILLNPSINPDGLNRFATWANMHKGKQPVADPGSREHNEAWPGGRTNHYWFDLNRDWMPLQHPESRARLEKYYEWRPNVLTDHHEMGTNSTFFFQPGVPSRNNPLGMKRVAELTEAIGQYHAKALNRIGSLYYTKEGYDDFYIGKGSSYPDITGCVGILFEQASSRGHIQESTSMDVTFPFTIRNQFTTSLSSLKASVDLRKELLSLQRDFYASSLKEAEKAQVKGYVFGSAGDPARSHHLLEILRRHQIQVHELAKPVRADSKDFDPGISYIIPSNQPQFRLLMALFEKRTTFDDSLFYDVSSWTLPLAFDLPYAELKVVTRDLLGKPVDDHPFPSGAIVGGTSNYAYVFEWKDYYAPRALYRLLKEKIKAKVATRPFVAMTVDGKRSFSYGTILIPLGIQQEPPEKIFALLERAAREDAVTVYSLQTGLSEGGVDLGSAGFVPLEFPKIALVVGTGVLSSDIGEAWHLLDHRFQMDVSLVETNNISRTSLDRYTCIVMAGGMYGSLDSSVSVALRRWIENGGTLIAMEQAAEWALNTRLATGKIRKAEPSKRDTVVVRRAYADEDKYSGALSIPGTIFEVGYDKTHPLLYGYSDSLLSVFRGNAIFLDPSKNPYATPLLYTSKPLKAGYLHVEYDRLAKNSAAIVVSGLRQGRVVLMADNPIFRAFWFGTSKLFLNGVFFGPVIRASSVRGDE
ncbi:MAG TPA: zinc carboxypeptidase [Bacteroidetes bacterium]|nr:zinc carboxypeptidase [Bacteroidota bacterium]